MYCPIRIVLVWLCLAAYSAARDIYVSNAAGDDRRDGADARAPLARHGPVRSISKALRLAQSGDRIIVENTGMPYRETLSLTGSRHSGSPIGPLVIEGGGATLDGSILIPPDLWKHHAGDVFWYQPARLGQQQLFVNGPPAIRRPLAQSAVSLPPLEPLEWCFWQGKIYFRVERGRLPGDYIMSCCGLQTGITLYYVSDVLIRDLIVQGFAVDGIAVHDVVRETRLERVTSRANGGSGVSVRGASWLELDGCLLVDNGRSQLRVGDFARLWLYDCKLIDTTAPAIQREGGQVTIEREPFAKGPAISP
jgi:hypothetical protein